MQPPPVLILGTLICCALAGCAGPKVTPGPTTPAPTPSTGGPAQAGPGGALQSPAAQAPALERFAESPDGARLPILHTIRQDTGLVIEDLKMGDGPDCMPNSQVTVRYHGTLSNGVAVDSTRGKAPAEFPLNRLIRGWREGMPGMKVGGIRRLTIPAALAYGDKQKGVIPPNSDLVFTIELLGVRE